MPDLGMEVTEALSPVATLDFDAGLIERRAAAFATEVTTRPASP